MKEAPPSPGGFLCYIGMVQSLLSPLGPLTVVRRKASRYRFNNMREDFTSSSFLAVAVVGFVLLCSGLLSLAFGA